MSIVFSRSGVNVRARLLSIWSVCENWLLWIYRVEVNISLSGVDVNIGFSGSGADVSISFSGSIEWR